MIIIQNNITSFILGKHYAAMCLHPFLLVNKAFDIVNFPETLNHERIHARQQIEMLWVFFFLWYVTEYLVRLLICRSHRKAYLSLSHEREAYHHAGDPGYLLTRRPFAWFTYLKSSDC